MSDAPAAVAKSALVCSVVEVRQLLGFLGPLFEGFPLAPAVVDWVRSVCLG